MKQMYYCLTVLITVFFTQISFAQTPIKVRGKLIDIFVAEPGGGVYPNGLKSEHSDFFPSSIPSIINGKEFATNYLGTGNGVTTFSGDSGRYVIGAFPSKSIPTSAWIDLNTSFTMSASSANQNTYYLFRRNISTTGTWYVVPQGGDPNAPTLIFADQGDVKWDDFTPAEGVIISMKSPSANLIADPSICVLPNGNLMAMCTGTAPKKQFRSSDGGLTWEAFGPDNIELRFATPFTHNGVLYVLSSFKFSSAGNGPGIFIRRSIDNGETWQTYNGNDHVVITSSLPNGALNCPSPVVISNGRIWRAMGDNGPDDQPNLGFMSASVNADLMNPSSWTFTNTIARESSVGRLGSGILKPWEPCAVANRNGGYPLMLARTEPSDARNGDASIRYRATSSTNIAAFSQSTDVIDFLGAKDKFCVQYDAVTDRYWALSNVAEASEYGGSEYIWSRRSRLVLMSSYDLNEWHIHHVVAHANNDIFGGYQYPFFVFDGNDIVAAIRTGAEYEDGLPVRAHDANMLTFSRVENFRSYLTRPIAVTLRKGWDMFFADANGVGQGQSPNMSNAPSAQSDEWEQINVGGGYYAYKKLGTNLAMQGGSTGSAITLQPFDISNQNQHWRKVKADFRHFSLEKRNSTAVIDGGSSTNGSVLTLVAPSSTLNQHWEIEPTRTVLTNSCSIMPYVQVNGGAWINTGTVSLESGDDIWFGPQSAEFGPTTSGWSWTGPNGYTYTGRAPVITDIQVNQAGTYTVTNTDQNGCTTSYGFTVSVQQTVSQVPIIVDGVGFTSRSFTNGTELFTNRTHQIQNRPAAFTGFQFAASDGGSVQNGNIIPTANGFVYVIASNVTDAGWSLVPNSTFNYSDVNQTSVSIYQHAAVAYVPVAIPNVTSFPGATPIASSVQVGIPAVQVQGTGYTKRTFTNGTLIFNNRTYVVQNVPAAFAGYEFVTSDGGSTQTGTITSPVNGFVYVIATNVTDAGWSLVPNSTFNYSDGGLTAVSIYQYAATANVAVAIPNVTNFAGASPLAKLISLNGAAKQVGSKVLTTEEDDSIQEESLVVYPNPTSGEFNIHLVGGEKADVSIFDVGGHLLYNKKNSSEVLNIENPGTFKTGVYIIKANSESGNSFVKKLIIK